jgi:glutamyl-tRNA reductase
MDINQFYIVGINYKKTDASVRGHFAVNTERYTSLLERASSYNISELFVLSTCNRTEVYGFAKNADVLIDLLCSETAGSVEIFKELAYAKCGLDAVEHLFNVAAGLDSQILGDYEIVGQIKQAARFSKERGFVKTFLERLINTVLQASKAIRSQTQLSSGTVSVSFAAVQFLRQNLANASNKKIVLLGTGKIGRNTCRNLVDYLDTKNITLINRTDDKAYDLANELDLQFVSNDEAPQQIQEADIIIVATNAEQPVLLKQDLINSNKKILIDLSIPNNIDPSAKELEHITLVNVDDLATINDATLQMRVAEVPKAKCLIAQHIEEFVEWYTLRKHVPVIKALKQKLMEMHQCNLFLNANPHIKNNTYPSNPAIQKALNNMALKMRKQNQAGCNYIEAINDFITNSVN